MANPRWTGASSTAWSLAGNWDTAAVPVDADSVYLWRNAVSIFSGLNQSAVQPTLLQIDATYTGKIGGTDATTNTLGTNYLQIGPLLCVIGEPSTSNIAGTGSGRIKLDFGTDPVKCIVRSTAQQTTDAGFAPVRLKGGSSASELQVQSGRVDVATEDPDETASLASFTVSGSEAVLTLGPGVTWVSGFQTEGTLNVESKGTTLNQQGGTATVKGTNLIRTITAGGTVYLNARFGVLAVSGITRSSTTATATVGSTAALATGDTVYITGADQAGYTGFKTITVASGTTFTFTTDDGDETPATGTITAYKAIESLSIVENGTVDFSGDSRPIHVKTMSMYSDASHVRNAASPTHLVIGTLALVNASTVKAE